MQVVQQLPKADIYVLESQIYRYTNLRIVPFLTNLRLMEAMLVTLLNPDLAQTCQYRTFFLKPNSVMKFFNLSVGGEKVSCRHIIQDIQRTALPERDPKSLVSNVDVPSMLWGTYWNEKSLGQERLSNCLLLAVAFYKLVVLKTHFLQQWSVFLRTWLLIIADLFKTMFILSCGYHFIFYLFYSQCSLFNFLVIKSH